MVSSSAGEGPGPVSSIGLTERRVFRRSMVSGMRKIRFALTRLILDGATCSQGPAVWKIDKMPVRSSFCDRRQPAALDVGWHRFIQQCGNGLVERQHLLPLAAEPPDRHRPAVGFPLAGHEQRRNLRQRMLAHLVVDLLVAK